MGSASEDCFSAAPQLPAGASRDPADRSSGEYVHMAAVHRYLAAHPDEAGQIVNLAPERIAVGFTGNGCRHRRGLARATGDPETQIIVFRAVHPARQVRAVHRALTAALHSGNPADLRHYDIVRWGPGLLGVEGVSILGKQPPETLRARLADLFTDGDQTMFHVQTITRDQLPTAGYPSSSSPSASPSNGPLRSAARPCGFSMHAFMGACRSDVYLERGQRRDLAVFSVCGLGRRAIR
ncbi:MAG TPA: hypothetical protein VE441_10450 [Mycobacterium sp.]|nr:hypothetical protein [Mycobacterium sp.]